MNATQADLLRFLRSMTAKQATSLSSDQQLLETFLNQRSEASFAALVQRHGAMVFAVCRRLLRHTQDAEDAFQATFLALARQAGSIRRQQALGSWLHGVAYRIAEKMKRTAARRAVCERGHAPLPSSDAMDDITWRELRLVLDEELGKLSEKYRAPLVLCYLEARTQDEAARQLGWSKNTFGRRLNQGRQMLARRLTRRGLTLPAALTAPLLIDGSATAALPPLLAHSTVRAGLAAAMGNSAGGIVSAQVVALAEGGVAPLLTNKASIAAALLLSLTLGIGGLLAQRAIPDRTFAQAPPAPSPPARSASKDQTIEIKGQVLDPDGKPFAGARLFLIGQTKQKDENAKGKNPDAPIRGTSDKEGRFRFTAQAAEFDAAGKATLAATAKGFGPAWIGMKPEKSDPITLQLVKDDLPIEGRVLDLEGQPVPGITVSVSRLMQTDLNAWFDERRRLHFSWVPGIELDAVNQAISCITDKKGRFHLQGFGHDRVVYVHMRGEKTANRDVDVVTRREVPRELSRDMYDVYPARFDYVVGPSKPIIGTVRDKRTGKPLAGVTVGFGMSRPWILTTTDEQGRYRLQGVRKRQSYFVAAGGVPFTSAAKFDIADTPGLDPVIADFEVERGIAVRGRLLDKATGKPVNGSVMYAVLNDNPHVKDFATLNSGFSMVDGRASADGSFTVTAIPGPGLLVATADDTDRFCGAETNKPWNSNATLSTYHAVVAIDLDDKDGKPAVQDILLEPGQTLKGSVVDPDGRSLKGAFVYGRRPVTWFGPEAKQKLNSDSFTISGLKPGRPRPLLLFQPEAKLGKLLRLGGDEKGPLVVRLEPLGALSGRVVDAQGHPLANHNVIVEFDWRELSATLGPRDADKSLPREMTYEDTLWKAARRNTTTNHEGKFRIEGLIPGVRYKLYVGGDELRPGALHLAQLEVDGLTVETGKTKDLGDLKRK